MKPMAHMAPFFSRCPEVAARETRTVKFVEPLAGLPAGEYGFLEFYCNEPTCDCRRVLFQVCRADRPDTVLATINYGWESERFYSQWLHGDLEGARELVAASLDPVNPQSDLSPLLLELFRVLLMPDKTYVDRLRRHYQMFKAAQRGPGGKDRCKKPS
ncbi:MAG TPA: hypothetical protein VF988_00410 [Verrucomicrobiae bacterium]